MIKYYYEMPNKLVYYSEQNVDFRILSTCKRCLKSESGNVQVLNDNGAEWNDYPIQDKEMSWIILKAKKIPRSWDKNGR